MDQRQRVVVVCGSGQILNSIFEEIMEYFQWLLDALGNQGWNARAIKDVVKQMSNMIKEYHESFKGIWFGRFVRVGREGPLEMITTCAVRTVSKGVGRGLNCSTKLLTFYSCRCPLRVSMEALICMVDHANERYNQLFGLLNVTLIGLRPSVMMGMMSYKVSITSTRIGSHRLLDAPPIFGSGMGLRVTRRTKRAMTKAGVVATNPKAGASTSLHITSGLPTLNGSNSVQKRQLGTTNSRYVCMQLFFIASC
jgi:hypothetical protein